MAITKPFSSQGTTIEIFSNPSAQTTLETAVASAMQIADTATKLTALKAAYTNFFSGGTLSKTIGGTGILATAPAQADGYFSGTWSKSGQSGTFSSTGSTATAITANFVLNSGTPASINLDAADLTFLTGNADKGTITVTSAVTSLLFTGSAGAFIGKITSAGDTGKTFAMISEKLINESGTFKGKGSSDEGDFTIDYLANPSDAGQSAMDLAFNDESSSANRVFRITHLASSPTGVPSTAQKVYFSGLVTELKKNRGTIDKIITVKSKIAIQNGLVEDNPA